MYEGFLSTPNGMLTAISLVCLCASISLFYKGYLKTLAQFFAIILLLSMVVQKSQSGLEGVPGPMRMPGAPGKDGKDGICNCPTPQAMQTEFVQLHVHKSYKEEEL